MDYDVVIATRNRPEALEISIPLILQQNRAPQKLIIVDASDDHERVRQIVLEVATDYPVDLEILQSKANSALQRNVGLKKVKSPIVMFPDDDSMWWPGVATAIMQIYEQDIDGDIGGVCAADAKDPPPGINLATATQYKMRISDHAHHQIARVRHKIDSRFRPSSTQLYGRSRWGVRPVPTWLAKENAVLVEDMGGYRMSFRTEAIQERGFDEYLGAIVGWAFYEDTELSFHVMQDRLLVGTHNAKVYHHKFPVRRADGFALGFIMNFNRAYIICKYAPPGSLPRRILKRRTIGRAIKSLLGVHTKFGRERLLGVLTAFRLAKVMFNTPPDHLRQRYLELCQEVFQKRTNT